MANPKTNLGKVLELFFDIWAITVVAALAGSFDAFFHARSKELDGKLNGEMGADRARGRPRGRDARGALLAGQGRSAQTVASAAPAA